eukprot:NODE_2903_length_1093_cov_30.391762_g2664_i0.p1 GENE.NODE_2903_length_1093_cov_30.391762_g2664_i0~~NODE_2903_length_1093_cov_30.391762_g2664_i0.p1  ORF type:complete len:102 (+),score=3.95 NODE_2903_length_1093_cov_30.391762_g2664_i0:85-390(+)
MGLPGQHILGHRGVHRRQADEMDNCSTVRVKLPPSTGAVRRTFTCKVDESRSTIRLNFARVGHGCAGIALDQANFRFPMNSLHRPAHLRQLCSASPRSDLW